MNDTIARWAGLLLILFPLLSTSQGDVTNARVLAESNGGEHWFTKGGSFRGDHYSPLDQVNAGNVRELGLAWSTELPIPDGTPTTPIVVDGVIYIGGAYSKVVAMDASDGRIIWTYDPDMKSVFAVNPRLSWISRANRGVAVWDRRVFVATADCRLIGIDARTGEHQWTQQVCDNDQGYSISDSPYVGGGKVFIGNAGSESEENNRGYVTAHDPATGTEIWRFYIVPSHIEEENDTPALKMAAKTWTGNTLETVGGGGNAWNEMTYDAESNQLFFGTSGSARYDYPSRSPEGGDNLFLSSIVAVNADTGEYNWHYQTVTEDSWDYNATMNIVVADVRIEGEDRETVLIAPKNGFHYALDRHTGELLTAGKYAKVNWATGINMETGRPDYDPAAEYWNAEDGEKIYFWPNFWGAHSWNPMAFHPGLGLTYIPVIDLPSEIDNQGNSEDVVMITEIDGQPHAPGKLVAIDPASQGIRWSVDHPLPYNGGIMATGGNLVFQGNSEGEFVAYAADTGTKLWSVQTGSAINASPASHALDGTQYIVIPIGLAGGLQYRYPEMHATERKQGPIRMMAFALGADATLVTDVADYPPLPEQPDLDATAEEIAIGEELYSAACRSCHGGEATARFGGSVPDLRYANAKTHATWHAIVVGGSRAANGMPSIEIPVEESEAIRNYVLSKSEEIRAAQ
ncbi:MAG: PQQ-dependent dehydrogenase, methanol/ethanol family [Woeseiaceae bacterium]|nr:PQQ-dependent dehydrogenase, methanol/ethanol family [Woeseiaceae bacterium]